MIPSVTIFILTLLLLIFCVYRKRLHLFEVIFIWMVVWLITHSISTILLLNLKLLALGKDTSDFWTHFFKRLLLYPMIVTFFFDFYLKVRPFLLKWALLGLCTLLLVALEFLFFTLGIIINKDQSFAGACLEWGLTVLLAFICWQWYRKKRLVR